MARSADAKTPLARLAFAQGLFKPQESDSGKKSWTCTLLFPKSTDLTVLQDLALAAAVEEWGDKAKKMIADGLIKSPFLDGDGPQGLNKKTGERHKGYEGCKFIRCTSGEDYRPRLFDKRALPTNDPDVIYSGGYVYAVVNAFTWENKENGRGITFGISMVQAAKDGEKLGGAGGPDPSKFFEAIPDEGDAPAEAQTGKGAAGLFG